MGGPTMHQNSSLKGERSLFLFPCHVTVIPSSNFAYRCDVEFKTGNIAYRCAKDLMHMQQNYTYIGEHYIFFISMEYNICHIMKENLNE